MSVTNDCELRLIHNAVPGIEVRARNLIALFNYSDLPLHLFKGVVPMPASGSRYHWGLRPARGKMGDHYYSGIAVRSAADAHSVEPANDHRIIFLVNAYTIVPKIVIALQHARRAALFSETPAFRSETVPTRSVSIGEGISVRVRTGEAMFPDGTGEMPADRIVPRDRIVEDSLAAALKPGELPLGIALAVCSIPREQDDRDYSEMPLPSAPYRLLAGFQVWGVFQHFFAYRTLLNEDWNAVLRQFLPQLEDAQTAREYHLAIAKMVTHVHDSHAFVESNELRQALGEKAPALYLRWIQNSPVVTQVSDETASAAGVSPGDVVVSIDGQGVQRRVDFISAHRAASTPQALMRDVCYALLAGPEGSMVNIGLRTPTGRTYQVSLERRTDFFWSSPPKQRSGEVLQILPGNIGYVDLDRLTGDQVENMFETLKRTAAIIFDMRGYPNGTLWQIAARLAKMAHLPALTIQRPITFEPDLNGNGEHGAFYAGKEEIVPSSESRYEGRTVMLIDERTYSQAEHTGLFLEVANGTKFIGGPTTGGNGDISVFVVPGGITIEFSGIDIRHGDGRRLQRVGLVPDVLVTPTIAGIADGHDEVLDRAITYLRESVR